MTHNFSFLMPFFRNCLTKKDASSRVASIFIALYIFFDGKLTRHTSLDRIIPTWEIVKCMSH